MYKNVALEMDGLGFLAGARQSLTGVNDIIVKYLLSHIEITP